MVWTVIQMEKEIYLHIIASHGRTSLSIFYAYHAEPFHSEAMAVVR